MKGQLLDYSGKTNEGVITVSDGSRYTFSGSEWKGNSQLTRGIWVDFQVQGSSAVAVYQALDTGSTVKPGSKSKPAATLWAIFLGGFGAHKFYMGSWGWGIVYLLTCWLYIPFIVALVEWIRYVLMSDEEFHAKVAEFQSKRPGPFSFFW